jgi:hypothetical protein
MILVVGSKGGVGATTLTVGLTRVASVNAWPVDLTGTGDPLFATDERQTLSLDAIARLSGYDLDRALDPASVRRRPAFVLSRTCRVLALRARRIAHVLDVMESHATIVADLGMPPLPAVFELATHVVLVLSPDPRSIRRAEGFAKQNATLNIVPVLNFARAGERMTGQDEVTVLPDVGSANPLRDERWLAALAPLADELGLIANAQPSPFGAHVPRRAVRSPFDFRSLIPRIKWVE